MEKSARYSKKREAILNTIRCSDAHPSADWIYQTLKSVYPDLSLGTVYRNLTRFKEEGLVVSVGTVNGQERFDATVSPHAHFICQRCGAVLDLPETGLKVDTQRLAEQYGIQIKRHELTFYGICSNCVQQKH